MTEELSIAIASDSDEAEWQDFLHADPDSNFFQDWRWRRVIGNTYGHEPVYLIARRDGKMVGGLPMIDVKSPLFGRSLISTAFTIGGGLLGPDESASIALANLARQEGKARKAAYIEMRNGCFELPGWQRKEGVYVSFSRAIEGTLDELLVTIPRRRRAEIRKGLKFLEEGRLSIDHSADPDLFYSLYARSLRDLGTPVFPKKLVNEIVAAFGKDAEFTTMTYDDEPVLGLCTFKFKKSILPYYVGMTENARESRAGDLVYFMSMKKAVEDGYTGFDFGRSKVGSTHELYKKTWGMDGNPIDYQYALLTVDVLPNVNPNNPKFQLATSVWKKLPLAVANTIGPMVAGNLA